MAVTLEQTGVPAFPTPDRQLEKLAVPESVPDFDEHRQTYRRFVTAVSLFTLHAAIILLAMAWYFL